MEIKILDKNKKFKKTLSSKEGDNVFFNDKYTSDLSTGAETFETDTNLSDIEEGDYVLFNWHEKYKMLQIKTTEDVECIDCVIKNIYSEFVGIELLNSYAREFKHEGNMTKLLTTILQGTNYEIGYVSPRVDAITAYYSISEPTAVYTILQNVITLYDNCELEFDVDVIDSINGKYKFLINVYGNGERGNKTYKRFEYNFNSYGMKRKGDITDFCSGLIGVGANGITFKDIEWRPEDNPPLLKPLGDDFLIDPEAHEMLNNGGKIILGKYKSDATTGIDLLWDTYYKLQEIKQTKFDYDIPVYMTDEDYENIDVGDTVYAINDKFDKPIELEARIGYFEISFTDRDKNKVTLSNYKDVKSKIKNIDSNTIIKDAIDEITGFTGKLTQSDIDRIREFLKQLDIEGEEIEKLLKKYEDSLKDTVVDKDEIAEDTENYKEIILSKIDNGLWLGDERIYDIKKNKCASITTSTSENETSSSATEYKNAVAYYNKFELGKYANSSSLSKLISSSNKYKINTIVKYWSKKFGLDPYLVYAIIMAESSGNPYCATKSSAGGYGIMQCERAAYFNKKQTIKFLDGSTKSFTPSLSTMKPGGTTTLNGVKVNKGISNQIMFGCHELRKSLVRFKYNIFASLMGYNFGLYGADWVVCKYVANKNNLTFKDAFGYTAQSSKVQELYFKELETLKAPWANIRKTYVSQKKMGTWWNIEGYLRWYKSVDGQLPYVLDSKGKKKGYGANKTSTATVKTNTTTKIGVATAVRNKIVAKAKEICELHQKYKKATYDQTYRIVNDDKRFKAPKSIYGIKNPYCYDCSSLVSCAYLKAGLNSVYAKSCQAGTLVESATKKSGYKMFKLTKTSINDAIPGDIIMFCNNKCPSSLTRSQAMSYKFTHHTAIYCGKVNGKHMMAHASKWAYHPNAIRYESFDAYNNQYKTKDYHIWNYCFILRPHDLAAKDKSATETTNSTPVTEANEVTLKGLPLATPSDYYDYKSLIEDITINNISDDDKYPKTVSHVFLHFGINDLTDTGIENYKSLIKALLVKYPKKPIFIAKEYHVNTQYPNYATINPQITNFNNAMRDFANQTKYVVIVNNPSQITTNAIVDEDITTNGWRMKDKASCDKYYKAYKKAILNMCQKEETKTSKKVDIVMSSQKNYKYGECQSVTLKLPSKAVQTFYSKIIFTTAKDFKFNQSNLVYLNGSDCTKGALIPRVGCTYTIRIYYNPDSDIKEKYQGSVSSKKKADEYYDYKDFKGKNDVIKLCETFYSNKSKFKYNTKTPLSFSNPADNISSWKTDGLYHCDCSTLTGLVYRGHSYQTSPYAKKTTTLKRSTKYSWTFNLPRTAAEQAKYCVEQGWVLNAIDYTEYSNVEPGDLLFYDRDNGENGRYMNISHVGICIGKDNSGVNMMIEATSVTGVFRKIAIKNNTVDKLLLVARVKKY
ncbi:transglycosylase SLT domain-containing protein [Terrisporobacter muris]|uniref:Transglycosylase SLT domain-containing protein n=1 Tax=Terrisporobacter muris TaxID=2963284 RepID=A0A9X2M7E5_9FIRM|nr:transglycosylase SLT domain-containing protein [Terrisporobacter muris]MCR1821304.1 transglycosylase SLT domain-containing protein [Terrisporobacter muris]